VDDAVVRLAAAHELVVTVEDGMITGGVGEAIIAALANRGMAMQCLTFGIPQRFLAHSSRAQIEQDIALTAPDIAASVKAALLLENPVRKPQAAG
jgi:1-deoxy-D-xylulose-5-phosphate synthase